MKSQAGREGGAWEWDKLQNAGLREALGAAAGARGKLGWKSCRTARGGGMAGGLGGAGEEPGRLSSRGTETSWGTLEGRRRADSEDRGGRASG